MAETEWAQRLLGTVRPESATHHMPMRVIDGIAAETVQRKLWCVVASSMPATTLGALLGLLRSHDRDVALLTTEPADPGEYRTVVEACEESGRTPAEAVILCTDPGQDRSRYSPHGARVLILGRHRPTRGTVAVADLDALADFLAARASYRAASTYHEI
jgi:hypothetical protein